jgi:hypothetical protein
MPLDRDDYQLWTIDVVKDNQALFIDQCYTLHKLIQQVVGDEDTTRAYKRYNIFQISGSSIAFYKLYKNVIHNIREYVGDDRPLWMSGWMNFHQPTQVLNWHNHLNSICHGYISIDPKNTTTKFQEYEIKNEVGKMYLGPSARLHKVEVDEPFAGHRITLGFDVSDDADHLLIADGDYNFIPVP